MFVVVVVTVILYNSYECKDIELVEVDVLLVVVK